MKTRSMRYGAGSMRIVLVLFFMLTPYSLLPTPAIAQSVDLLWQGDTYTPPFYHGRSLWSNQSRISFVAIPHDLGNPANLNYKWTKNGTILGNINGIGKNTLSFVDPIISKPQIIKVEVLASDKTVLATRSVLATPIPPVLTIYENNPLYGFLFNREVNKTFQLEEKEVTFTAFPFFFNVSNRLDGTIGYEWDTNAETGAEAKNSVTYRIPDGAKGTSEIHVSASSTEKLLESAVNSFVIRFGI